MLLCLVLSPLYICLNLSSPNTTPPSVTTLANFLPSRALPFINESSCSTSPTPPHPPASNSGAQVTTVQGSARDYCFKGLTPDALYNATVYTQTTNMEGPGVSAKERTRKRDMNRAEKYMICIVDKERVQLHKQHENEIPVDTLEIELCLSISTEPCAHSVQNKV